MRAGDLVKRLAVDLVRYDFGIIGHSLLLSVVKTISMSLADGGLINLSSRESRVLTLPQITAILIATLMQKAI
jgi:hypothetical protein